MKELTKVPYKKFESENCLILKIAEFLGMDGYKVRLEVPNSGQSADLVAEKNNCILIIEGKLKNWKRALAQCKTHENVADFVSIAWGGKGISIELVNEAKKRGYGILHCSGQDGICGWSVLPQKNKHIWCAQREHWEKFLKEVPIEY